MGDGNTIAMISVASLAFIFFVIGMVLGIMCCCCGMRMGCLGRQPGRAGPGVHVVSIGQSGRSGGFHAVCCLPFCIRCTCVRKPHQIRQRSFYQPPPPQPPPPPPPPPPQQVYRPPQQRVYYNPQPNYPQLSMPMPNHPSAPPPYTP
ncbi:hypothetical protein BOX15_Mlig006969g1 [Macrostomum lignano]|uniref:Uncharacterized protein n=1 Tax=Macrostomum lignano TaxID=282301 RepID=A0A267GNT6_9PLAT|nr:hypothetical protein BOX15_Mlig006969g1 [Macrostomum lignano]